MGGDCMAVLVFRAEDVALSIDLLVVKESRRPGDLLVVSRSGRLEERSVCNVRWVVRCW